jgi:DNA-binding response OmpR family regulator
LTDAKPILIVEDDASIREALVDSFTAHGAPVEAVADGVAALRTLTGHAGRHRAVLLDLRLPGVGGLEVLVRMRAAGNTTPVLIVTARGEEEQRIAGLRAGADDYVVKPFSFDELHARLDAVTRRAEGRATSLRVGDAEVDLAAHEIRRGGTTHRLKQKEAEVLRYLVDHRGQTVERATLLREIWGYEHFPTTRTVDTHVFQLRRKLEGNGEPRHLRTVHGVGYRLVW